MGFKAKAKAKDLGIKAKAKDLEIKAKANIIKDLEFKVNAKVKDLRIGPKDRQGPMTKAKDTSLVLLISVGW